MTRIKDLTRSLARCQPDALLEYFFERVTRFSRSNQFIRCGCPFDNGPLEHGAGLIRNGPWIYNPKYGHPTHYGVSVYLSHSLYIFFSRTVNSAQLVVDCQNDSLLFILLHPSSCFLSTSSQAFQYTFYSIISICSDH